MSRKRRQEKLAVLMAQSRRGGRRVRRTRHLRVRRARFWLLVLAVGGLGLAVLGVLHEFL
jgi:hypothetical protein